jgi:hypothetical protein
VLLLNKASSTRRAGEIDPDKDSTARKKKKKSFTVGPVGDGEKRKVRQGVKLRSRASAPHIAHAILWLNPGTASVISFSVLQRSRFLTQKLES